MFAQKGSHEQSRFDDLNNVKGERVRRCHQSNVRHPGNMKAAKELGSVGFSSPILRQQITHDPDAKRKQWQAAIAKWTQAKQGLYQPSESPETQHHPSSYFILGSFPRFLRRDRKKVRVSIVGFDLVSNMTSFQRQLGCLLFMMYRTKFLRFYRWSPVCFLENEV